MNNSMLFVILLIVINSCSAANKGGDEPQNSNKNKPIEIYHYNIIIAPDLSNRINPRLESRALSDDQIVKVVLNNIYPKILNFKRSQNQLDKFSVSFINKKWINIYQIDTKSLQINFGDFPNQRTRIDYIKGRSSGPTLPVTINRFIKEYQRINLEAVKKTAGADIWSFFNTEIDNTIVNTHEQSFILDDKKYVNKFKNIMILLTDGYIEAGIFNKNGCPNSNQ